MRTHRIIVKLALAACILAVDLFTPAAFAKDEEIISVGTGSVTGVYYPAGGAICRLVNRARKEHGIHCYVESTGGSVANIDALREGELGFGIAQSDWQYKAYNGDEVFADKTPFVRLRSVFSLHSEMFTLAVAKGSSIRSFADLKGKRVNIGDAGSGMRATMHALMELYHWNNASFSKALELRPADAAHALCTGKIDAMVFTAGHPNGLIQEITANCGARLVPVEGRHVEELIHKNPYFSMTAIPGAMYTGNPKNISTFGMKATLLTTSDMDDEAVYQLTKAVFENFDSFKTLHFVFATLDKERMINAGLIAPLHPGALRYYREVGLVPPAQDK